MFGFLFVSLLSSLFLCFWLWSCIKLKHHKNNLSFTDFDPFSFACFCDACLIPDTRQQTKHQTAITGDNSRQRPTISSFGNMVWKSCTKSFTWRYLSCSLFASIKSEKLQTQPHDQTRCYKDNWCKRKLATEIISCKKTQNCWKRFTSFWPDVGLSYLPDYAHDQDYFEVPSDFDELAKEETNLVLFVSLLRFQDYKTLQRFGGDFQISARRVSCSMWLKYQVKFCGSNHFMISQQLRSVFVWCLQILINSHNFVSFVLRKLLLFLVLDLFLILIWVFWTNYWCEFGEKCSQTEFVWLLWNWW